MKASSTQGATIWWKVLLALLSGALFFFISTPMPLALLQWGVWVPLLVALEDNAPRRDFFLGWLGGVALNAVGFYWIIHTIVVFSNLPMPLALLALGLFAAYGGLPFGLLGVAAPRIRQTFGAWSVLVTPAVWVTIEFLFPQIFPFHQGDVQFRQLPVLQLASITGIYGVSYLIMASNLALYELLVAARGRGRWPIAPVAAVAVLIAATVLWGSLRVRRIDAAIAASPRVRVGLIQGNYGVQERRGTTPDAIFARYRRLSEEAVARGATLLIWGEGASPYAPHRSWSRMQELVRELNVDLITGGDGRSRIDGVMRHYNSAYGLSKDSRDGDDYQRYNKRVLLAFGEYMPGSSIFPWLKGKIQGIGDFTPGDAPGLFTFRASGGTVRALLLICYEAILDRFVLEQASSRPNLLVNITHDAWFGDTACPHQFLMLVVSRAVEHGSSVARVANTGISAVIDPTGLIRGETPLFQQAVQVEDLTIEQFPTLYQRIGDLFALVCGLVTVAVAGSWWRRGTQWRRSV